MIYMCYNDTSISVTNTSLKNCVHLQNHLQIQEKGFLLIKAMFISWKHNVFDTKCTFMTIYSRRVKTILTFNLQSQAVIPM